MQQDRPMYYLDPANVFPVAGHAYLPTKPPQNPLLFSNYPPNHPCSPIFLTNQQHPLHNMTFGQNITYPAPNVLVTPTASVMHSSPTIPTSIPSTSFYSISNNQSIVSPAPTQLHNFINVTAPHIDPNVQSPQFSIITHLMPNYFAINPPDFRQRAIPPPSTVYFQNRPLNYPSPSVTSQNSPQMPYANQIHSILPQVPRNNQLPNLFEAIQSAAYTNTPAIIGIGMVQTNDIRLIHTLQPYYAAYNDRILRPGQNPRRPFRGRNYNIVPYSSPNRIRIDHINHHTRGQRRRPRSTEYSSPQRRLIDLELIMDFTDVLRSHEDSRGLEDSELNQLPTKKWESPADPAIDSDIDKCMICLENYEDQSVLRVLRCQHEFHASCVDTWLKFKPTCPLCRTLTLKRGESRISYPLQ